jgi:hypothetical protein
MAGGCAVQKENSVGVINGVYINKQEFLNSLRGHYTGFVLEKERTPDDSEKRELYDKTWNDITIHVILKDYFSKYNIQVTQKEVIDTLLNNIPASITKAPVFQTAGVFDKSLYIKALVSDKDRQLDWLKRHYYNYYVPLSKLKKELQAHEVISEKETKELARILNTSADVQWIVFDPSDKEVSITQAEVESYYLAHQNEYRTTRYARYNWVQVPVLINSDDVLAAKSRIDSIYFELTNGKPFMLMVERFSKAGSAGQGGSLGFVRTDELSSTVRNAIEGLDTYSYSRPVRIDKYWVIYQVAERTRNMVKINELAIEINPEKANIEKTKEKVVHMRDLALQLGLELAAEEMNFQIQKTGIVTADSVWLPDGDVRAYLSDRAYTQKQGSILEPVYSNAMQAWILIEVAEVQPLERKALHEVSDEIMTQLKQTRQKEETLKTAETWILKNHARPLTVAAKDGLQIVRTDNLNVNGSVLNEPVESFYIDMIKSFSEGRKLRIYQSGKYILCPVITLTREIKPPLIPNEEVRHFYFSRVNPGWFNDWLQKEIREARVKTWFSYP